MGLCIKEGLFAAVQFSPSTRIRMILGAFEVCRLSDMTSVNFGPVGGA